jgi:hypothetical protein
MVGVRVQTNDPLQRVVVEIEAQLLRLDAVSYVVDVRERFSVTRPVLATVVDRSDVLHMLLFIRAALKEAQLTARRQDSAPSDKTRD